MLITLRKETNLIYRWRIGNYYGNCFNSNSCSKQSGTYYYQNSITIKKNSPGWYRLCVAGGIGPAEGLVTGAEWITLGTTRLPDDTCDGGTDGLLAIAVVVTLGAPRLSDETWEGGTIAVVVTLGSPRLPDENWEGRTEGLLAAAVAVNLGTPRLPYDALEGGNSGLLVVAEGTVCWEGELAGLLNGAEVVTVDDELEGGTKGLFGTVEFNNTEVSVALALSALEQRITFLFEQL